jgi:hypothetical protein
MTFIIKKQINKEHKAMLKPQCLGVSMTQRLLKVRGNIQ